MVGTRTTISSIAQPIGRLGRAGSWLRRNRRNMLLVALVAISLGESLLCILHCDIWLPLMLSQSHAVAHHHHMAGMDMSGMIMPEMSADTALTDQSTCHLRNASGAQVPFHVPPSPIHETLPVLMLLLVPAVLVRWQPQACLATPLDPFAPPPFQPPRPFTLQTLPHA